MKKVLRFFGALIFILLLACVGTLIVFRTMIENGSSIMVASFEITPPPTPIAEYVSLNYVTPIGVVNGPVVGKGDTVAIDDGPEIENYTFLYWTDASGEIETADSITILEDTWYSAVYTVALNTRDHIPYLSPDENGLMDLDGFISRGELANVFYSLLKVKVSGTEAFDDVPRDADCYDAAAALKSLNVISGNVYRPDENASWRDVLSILRAFYPNDGDFSDKAICDSAEAFGWIDSAAGVPSKLDAEITRCEFAALMNRVLGRSFNGSYPTGELEERGSEVCEMLEACTIHSYEITGGSEVWTEYQAVDQTKPGFMLIGSTLYYVNENHSLLKNGEVNGFTFDAEGKYTSGDTELDAMVQDLIARYWEDDGDMIELLHRIFNHLAFDSVFISNKHYYDVNDIPTIDLAKRFITEGKGNCYFYSAAFIEVARALGYDASWVIGNVRRDPSLVEHGWVICPIDDVIYYFDPEMEPICKPQGCTSFMMTEQRAYELGFRVVG